MLILQNQSIYRYLSSSIFNNQIQQPKSQHFPTNKSPISLQFYSLSSRNDNNYRISQINKIYSDTKVIRFINSMKVSRLIEQEKVYVKFDNESNTSIVKQDNIQPGFCYRRVRETYQGKERQSLFNAAEPFIDKQFVIDESKLEGLSNTGRVILVRLYDLYKMNKGVNNPQFFPSRNSPFQKKLSSDPYLPSFATQLGLFPAEYYKSFFITQNFNPSGKYEMIINHNGRFELDVVDDWVPVNENTLEPLWGFDVDQSWKIILLKFWAKRCNGYQKVQNARPFDFIQCFSNSNWKYFNLTKDGLSFLSKYTGKTDLGKFILKTKSSQNVKQSGLIPDSAGYEVLSILQTTEPSSKPDQKQNNQQHRKWVITVRSTMINKWSGSMSVLDKQINSRYYPEKQKLSLQRDFMITETDFINLFSTAYIASRRDQKQKHYVSDYYLLTVQPDIKRSIYLKFEAEKDGWFDFCLRQADDIRVAPTDQSKMKQINHSQNHHDDGMRYLKCKYTLVKQNNADSPSIYAEPDYEPLRYDTYEIQYYHGYNRSDAKFLNLVKGTYILKIKPEAYNKTAKFVINYASNLSIKIKQFFPDDKERSHILRQSMASLIGPMANADDDGKSDRKFEEIVFANYFTNIGHGFVGARLNRSCPYSILIEVNPSEVRQSGYTLKNQFKNLQQPFSIFVKPAETSTIVLKRIEGQGVKHIWPPKGITVFKNSDK